MTDDDEFYHDIGRALMIKENNAIQRKKFTLKIMQLLVKH
tara:strand:- start:37 stop:156 length:120 start_codon:yes stop_codon:yes gene_type:complete